MPVVFSHSRLSLVFIYVVFIQSKILNMDNPILLFLKVITLVSYISTDQ